MERLSPNWNLGFWISIKITSKYDKVGQCDIKHHSENKIPCPASNNVGVANYTSTRIVTSLVRSTLMCSAISFKRQ